MGEGAQDFGGLEKSFSGYVSKKSKKNCLTMDSLKDFAKRYYTSGIIMGLSVLQNGKIPSFLSVEQLQKLIDDSSCMVNLRNGLHKVGFQQLMAKLPKLDFIPFQDLFYQTQCEEYCPFVGTKVCRRGIQ